MDMLVPYTPLSDLSEEQKQRAASAQTQNGYVLIDGKYVSVNELRGIQKPTVAPVRQNLFE